MSGSYKQYDCDECEPGQREARNCEGQFGHEKFTFQVGYPRTRDDLDDCFIYECPQGYITEFSHRLWDKYQDLKLRKSLGLSSQEPSKLHFECYKVIANAIEDWNEFDSKKKKPKKKGGTIGGRFKTRN